jgi:hypothetical protein
MARSRLLPRALPVLVLLSACSDTNFEPINARPLDPPSIYLEWWDEVERCTGVEARFDRINWFETDEIIDRDLGSSHPGVWQPPHSIFIAHRHLYGRSIVKHEMIHDLLQTGDHSDPLFDRCSRF